MILSKPMAAHLARDLEAMHAYMFVLNTLPSVQVPLMSAFFGRSRGCQGNPPCTLLLF